VIGSSARMYVTDLNEMQNHLREQVYAAPLFTGVSSHILSCLRCCAFLRDDPSQRRPSRASQEIRPSRLPTNVDSPYVFSDNRIVACNLRCSGSKIVVKMPIQALWPRARLE